jgi:hypothetical protein
MLVDTHAQEGLNAKLGILNIAFIVTLSFNQFLIYFHVVFIRILSGITIHIFHHSFANLTHLSKKSISDV